MGAQILCIHQNFLWWVVFNEILESWIIADGQYDSLKISGPRRFSWPYSPRLQQLFLLDLKIKHDDNSVTFLAFNDATN